MLATECLYFIKGKLTCILCCWSILYLLLKFLEPNTYLTLKMHVCDSFDSPIWSWTSRLYCMYIFIECMCICNEWTPWTVWYAKPYRTHPRKVYCNIMCTFVNIQTKFTHYVLIIMVVVSCMFYFRNISDRHTVVKCFALLLHIQGVPHSIVGVKPQHPYVFHGFPQSPQTNGILPKVRLVLLPSVSFPNPTNNPIIQHHIVWDTGSAK